MEAAITDYGNSVLYSSARNEQLIVRMKQMLERTVWALTNQLKAGDFVPEAYELRFFGGKIDRVDVCENEEKVYVKVMDYKTGSKAFDIVALYHGLQLQLMIYMDAAIEFQKKRHPGRLKSCRRWDAASPSGTDTVRTPTILRRSFSVP